MGEYTICEVNKQPEALVFNEIIKEKKGVNFVLYLKFSDEFLQF
jgi:hypothetical protein